MITTIWLSIIAVIPLIIWLVFFWLRDYKQKEPAFWIVLTILLGGVSAFLALYVQTGFHSLFPVLASKIYAIDLFGLSIVSILEEGFKFLVVFIVFKLNKDFDEPIDFMIYMIFSAIGFATIENLVAVLAPNTLIIEGIQISLMRMITADLLHIIASGMIGFFWALSFVKRRVIYLYTGIVTSMIYHTIYNLILTVSNYSYLLFNLLFIIVSAIIIISLFTKVSEFKINFKKLDYETR